MQTKSASRVCSHLHVPIEWLLLVHRYYDMANTSIMFFHKLRQQSQVTCLTVHSLKTLKMLPTAGHRGSPFFQESSLRSRRWDSTSKLFLGSYFDLFEKGELIWVVCCRRTHRPSPAARPYQGPGWKSSWDISLSARSASHPESVTSEEAVAFTLSCKLVPSPQEPPTTRLQNETNELRQLPPRQAK